MSLTSFLKNRDVKAEFARQFPKPKFSLEKEILAPPRTGHRSLVGVAFDYLLRFYLKRLNPDAVTRRWVAEDAINRLIMIAIRAAGLEAILYADTGEIGVFDRVRGEETPAPETNETRKAKQIIEQAKTVYSNYLLSGEIIDELMESALLLAQLDPIVRAGYIDKNLGTVDKEDVADLRNLISIVNPDTFRAKELCMLNPTFGEASKLVGGADADLLIDDTLIEIKTVKDLKLKRDYFDQLMGYYTLFRLGRVDYAPHTPRIERIGIYYSRYGEFYTIPIRDVVNEETFPPFIEWFKSKAEGVASQAGQ